MLANDTEENRRDLTRMSLRTFYVAGGTAPGDLTEPDNGAAGAV